MQSNYVTIVLIAKQQILNIKIEDLNFNKKKAKLFHSYKKNKK